VPQAGDLWLWVAIDADTKLVPCLRLGSRTADDAFEFMQDLASRFKNRVQLTTDGFRPYLEPPASIMRSWSNTMALMESR
jgi:IS1 family transposase